MGRPQLPEREVFALRRRVEVLERGNSAASSTSKSESNRTMRLGLLEVLAMLIIPSSTPDREQTSSASKSS